MFGFLYLILTITFGISIVLRFINVDFIYEKIGGKEFSRKVPKCLFAIPTGIIIGMLFVIFFI